MNEKTIFRIAFVQIACIMLVYLAGVFITIEWNPFVWDTMGRVMLVLNCLWVSMLAHAILDNVDFYDSE